MTTRHTITRRGFVTTIGVTGAAALAGKADQTAQSAGVTLALLGAAHMHTPMFLKCSSRERT